MMSTFNKTYFSTLVYMVESLEIFEFQPQLLVYRALCKRNATYMLMSSLYQSIVETIIFGVSRIALKLHSLSRYVKKIVC